MKTEQANIPPEHNLPPRDYERFIGRQHELTEVRRLLHPKSRPYLVTVDGIGGIGKSALALEAAYAYLDPSLPADEEYEAIIWLSAKRTVLTPERIETRIQQFQLLGDVFAAIAHTLTYPAITQARVEDQRAIVERVLTERRTLLILDNLETVDDPALLDFLRDLPTPTKALITTRHRIDNAYPVSLIGMPQADAFALMAQEAERHSLSQISTVREALWERTGGVPLAIVWSIGLIALGEPAEDVIRRLGNGQSDIIEFCFAQSMALIRGRDAYTLLLAAAQFRDDASRAALGAVSGLHDDQFGVERGLDQLVQLSLLAKDQDRYSLLTLTRVLLRSEAQRDPALVRAMTQRWVTYYDQLVDTLSGWSSNWRGHDAVEHELTNIFDVYQYLVHTLHYVTADGREQHIAAESLPQVHQLLRLFDKVARTCRIRGYWGLIETESASALHISRSLSLPLTGWICYTLARISYVRSDYGLAQRWAQEMVDVADTHANTAMIMRSRLILGNIALAENQLAAAESLLDTAWANVNHTEGTGRSNVLTARADLASHRGDYARAIELYQSALDVASALSDKPRISLIRLALGSMQVAFGEHAPGRANLEESLVQATESGWLNGVSDASLALARLYLVEGNTTAAITYAQRAQDGFRRLGMETQDRAAADLLAQLTP